MLRYWTGEDWSDEVRPARPPLPATRVEEDRRSGEQVWTEWDRRNGLRALDLNTAGGELCSAGAPPETATAVPRDPWQSRVGLEAVLPRSPAPPEGPGIDTSEAGEPGAPRLLWELTKFAMVALLAVVAGALVAAVGIALTV